MNRRLLLSHHPLCEKFESHTFKVGKYHLCKGCFLGYPTAVIVILLWTQTSLFVHTTYIQVFELTILTFLLNGLKATRLNNHESFSLFLKVDRGITLALGIIATWKAPSPFLSISIGAFLFTLYLIYIYSGIRRYMKVCKNCEYYNQIPNCPGFTETSCISFDESNEAQQKGPELIAQKNTQ